ncbi:hypothetical protein Moror_14610 [Moniliophthora roreri MCA 2997]|uniref:Uncharacterized protein n=1 Tax=Moniliophthora roreri (strain MCA 2997) TaxID=1381753 RepID=V2XL74_MONRO|nr:hypothetical protein Moror_14610 [Moniliophthora roreri MCA 2997]
MFTRFTSLLTFGLLFVNALGLATPIDLITKSTDVADLSIEDITNALDVGFVKHINVFITLDSLVTNLVNIDFTVENPLPLELTLESASGKGTLNGTTYADFNHTFIPPVVIPALGEMNTGVINNVLLTQGTLATLDIIPLGVLDLEQMNIVISVGGITIPINGLEQKGVPTAYELDLGSTTE